jgi:hypothetical protein
MFMILNNLDPEVAQFPQELVTYGGNGQVFSNWAQVSAVPARQVTPLHSRFRDASNSNATEHAMHFKASSVVSGDAGCAN